MGAAFYLGNFIKCAGCERYICNPKKGCKCTRVVQKFGKTFCSKLCSDEYSRKAEENLALHRRPAIKKFLAEQADLLRQRYGDLFKPNDPFKLLSHEERAKMTQKLNWIMEADELKKCR